MGWRRGTGCPLTWRSGVTEMRRAIALALALGIAAVGCLPPAGAPTREASPTASPTPTQTAGPRPRPTPTPTRTPVPTFVPTLLVTPGTPTPGPLVDGLVVVATDGDVMTVILDGKPEQVRLLGVDTPEVYRTPECFGQEAASFTSSLVPPGTVVHLEKDVSDLDSQGRVLRYVYLPDGRMLNALLLAQGYARAAVADPDVKYRSQFLDLERQARDAGLGLWTACAQPPAPTAPPPPPSRPTLVREPGTVAPGGQAFLEVSAWAGARCAVTIMYSTGPSRAPGLEAKVADAQGRVSWSWTVERNAPTGTWPVVVDCESRTAGTAITVR